MIWADIQPIALMVVGAILIPLVRAAYQLANRVLVLEGIISHNGATNEKSDARVEWLERAVNRILLSLVRIEERLHIPKGLSDDQN